MDSTEPQILQKCYCTSTRDLDKIKGRPYYPNKKYDVPIELLDKNKIIKKSGIRVILYLDENGEIIRLEYDKENTEKSKRRIKTKLKRLLTGRHLKVNRA